MPEHSLDGLHVGARRHRKACRRSCGVIDGNVSSAFWHFATAGPNTRARQFEFRSTPPRWSVKTSASRPLPAIAADSSSASVAGKGTERRSQVFGVLHTRPPDSVTERDTFTRRRNMSKSDKGWHLRVGRYRRGAEVPARVPQLPAQSGQADHRRRLHPLLRQVSLHLRYTGCPGAGLPQVRPAIRCGLRLRRPVPASRIEPLSEASRCFPQRRPESVTESRRRTPAGSCACGWSTRRSPRRARFPRPVAGGLY